MTKLLSKLSIVKAPLKHPTDPLIQRQNKLIAKLEVQREMVQCELESKTFQAFKFKYITDPETGTKSKIRLQKQIKPWHYRVSGELYTTIRYGSRSLELKPKLYAIAVKDIKELISVYQIVIDSVKNGEFNDLLMAISAPKRKSIS